MVKHKWTTVFLISFFAVLLLFTFIYQDAIIYKRAKTIKIDNAAFGSEARDSQPLPPAVTFAPQGDDNFTFRDVEIRFKMKAHSITEYNNVFQTAAVNTGIRLELAKPSILALIVGSRGPEGFKGFILTRSLELNKWHSVHIKISRDKRLKVSLDNRTVVDSPERDIYFNLSDIALGTGFSRTRPFDGSIGNFSMTARFFEKRYSLERVLLVFKIVLVFGLISILLFSLPVPEGGLNPSATIGITGLIILIGFVSAVFYYYSQGAYLGWKYPFDTFLSDPESIREKFRLLDERAGPGSVNGNPLSLLWASFSSLSSAKQSIAYIVFTLLPAICLIGYNYRKIVASLSKETKKSELYTHVLIFSLLTYPFLLALDRGGSELLVCLLAMFFAHFFSLEKFRTSAWFLSFAAAFKIYPLVFLALFIVKKKYKEALFSGMLAVLIAGALFLLDRWAFGRWTDVSARLDPRMFQVPPGSVLQFNSSLLGALHFLSVSLFHLWNANQLLMIYLPFAAIIFLWLIYYLVKGQTELWKQVLFLFVATLLLMPVSPDERLLLLLVPFWLFGRNQGTRGSGVFYTVSIAALLIPKQYLVGYESAEQAGPLFASISIVSNPLIMILILAKGVSETLKARTNTDRVHLGNAIELQSGR